MTRRMMTVIMSTMACIAGARPVQSTEIATGRMLGPGYDQRAFYVRDAPNRPWRKTYSRPDYRAEAQGRLNLRIAQAFFHDEWMTEFPFDPAAHTRRAWPNCTAGRRTSINSVATGRSKRRCVSTPGPRVGRRPRRS